jgi:hypothetical protein
VAVPVGQGTGDAIVSQIDGFRAEGDTPIGLALQRMAQDDVPAGALATVVLFSDGRDECYDADLDGDPAVGPSWGPDPCQVARDVAGAGVDLRIERIDTIGFQAADAEAQLRCIAGSTGGTYTPVETEDDLDQIGDVLERPMRESVRLGGDPIEGSPTADGAPELERIAPGQPDRRYTDTIGVNEERWYQVADYGPGGGDTTATFFNLPAEEGITLEIRMEPGEGENISGPLEETVDHQNLLAPSSSIRCPGCHIQDDDSHALYWVVALRSDNPAVQGTFDLELLLEGEGWGGPPGGCPEGTSCWYEGQIRLAEAQMAQLQEELGGDRTEVLDQIDRLEAELAQLTEQRASVGSEGGGTSWTLPIALGLLALGAGGAWMVLTRRSRTGSEAAADATASEPDDGAVIGTVDLGAPPAEAGSPDVAAGGPEEPAERSAVLTGSEVPTSLARPKPPGDGREVPLAPVLDDGSRDASDDVPDRPDVPGHGPEARRDTARTEAGWYGDPGNPDHLRWWDGAAWTDHTQRRS